MITRKEAAEYFQQLIESKPGWQKLVKSQFVVHLSVFVSWCLREALWRLERLNQEFFISTAINDSSIMAHAEDREYIPRKRVASTGTVSISNIGERVIGLPVFTEFIASNSLPYMITEAAAIPVGLTPVEVACSQGERISGHIEKHVKEYPYLETTVTSETPYFTILIPPSESKRLAGYTIDVRLRPESEFTPWQYARLFRNSWLDEHNTVYDEFYSHTGQTGIRFGNGTFGMMLPVGSVVRLTLTLTEGETTLTIGQPLLPVENFGDYKVTVAGTIDGGSDSESFAEMKKNIHYWTTYQGKLVWDDDYTFFVKRVIGGIVFIRAWGEEDQEAVTGFSTQNINRIFITAYKPGESNLSEVVLARVNEVHLLNRHFTWVPPVFTPFALTITGEVARTSNIGVVTETILATLYENYGKDSDKRREKVYLNDFYSLIEATGCFVENSARFQVETADRLVPVQLQEMIHTDITKTIDGGNSVYTTNGTTINLTYV